MTGRALTWFTGVISIAKLWAKLGDGAVANKQLNAS
jgi:hypothetical protein